MRSVSVLNRSVSKYLSKSVHFLTAFVYLFTFLGPSIALATSTLTYTETVQEEQVVLPQSALPTPTANTVFAGTGRTVGDSSSAHQEESRQRDQNEKYINISKGWGNKSLYFGIGQTVQYLVSPLILSQGQLPYEEVVEEGYSLGFQGDIPGLGHFLCCWDGELLLQGNRTKSSSDLAQKDESPLSLGEARLLLKPYLHEESDCVEGDEWTCYSASLIGAPLNETFKSGLAKRVNDAWYDLEKRLQGAFIPLIKSLGLDEKAFWDLRDYITVVSKSASFLRQYQATDEISTINLDVIKAHLSTSTLDPYANGFIVLQDEIAEEVLVLWTQLARQIGDEFTAQAERSDLNEFTFASFQTLASFANALLDHINETSQERTLYVEGQNPLVLETFAPVTFSNFIAKAVKATAKRIFFRGESSLDEATLIPTKDSDLEAFCQTALGSITSVKELNLRRGVLTNFGSFTGERVTIGQGARFVNGGHATIENLRGQGLFFNHGLFDGLVKMSIFRFINRNNAFFAPRAECHFEDVAVSGAVSQFLNDEDALLEADTLVFERHQLFRPSAVQNKGEFVIREGMTLKGRDFINGGDAEVTEIDLQNAQLINEEHQTISGVRSLKVSAGSTVKNAGTFATQGVVAYDIFMLLANQEQGRWDHEGDVVLDEERVEITGSVSLRNGLFLTDQHSLLKSMGNLSLESIQTENFYFQIDNHGKLKISSRLTERKSGIIVVTNNNNLLLTESVASRHYLYHVNNKGIHVINSFRNEGIATFGDTHWSMGSSAAYSGNIVFVSDDFLEDVKLWRVFNYHKSQIGKIIFPRDLTFLLPYSLDQIEVSGNLSLPDLGQIPGHLADRLKSLGEPRSLDDLKGVTCRGETHIALPTFTLTEDITFEKLHSLHITCTEAIKIQARLKAPEIFLNGQKGFDLCLR